MGGCLRQRSCTSAGVARSEEDGTGSPIARDTIFRISSMTKPITAVAVLMLVEDCVLRLDDPVDAFAARARRSACAARPGGAARRHGAGGPPDHASATC